MQTSNKQFVENQENPAITWFGYDSRFSHRKGGRPHGEHSWLDAFAEPNQNFPVCSTEYALTLDRGAYRVEWDTEVIFKEPVCVNPRNDYPVLLSLVYGDTVNGRHKMTFHSQVYVCANRNGLKYSGKLVTDFDVTARGVVQITISAFNDEKTQDPTFINAKEMIVNTMNVTYRATELTDNILNSIYPIR